MSHIFRFIVSPQFFSVKMLFLGKYTKVLCTNDRNDAFFVFETDKSRGT